MLIILLIKREGITCLIKHLFKKSCALLEQPVGGCVSLVIILYTAETNSKWRHGGLVVNISTTVAPTLLAREQERI